MGVSLDQLPLSGVSPSVLLVAYLTIGLAVARLALGVFLLARGLPTRSRPVLRVCVVISCLVAGTSLFFVGTVAWHSGTPYYVVQMVSFSLLLVGCAAAVHYLCETSWLVALFVSTAGYTIQNLASGTDELVSVVSRGPSEVHPVDPGQLVIFLLVTAAIYIPYYLTFVRAVRRAGLERVEDRSMVVVMALVMLVVIGFDLVIKGLTGEPGVTLGSVVALRGVHGLACAFTLWLEYTLLYRQRLATDVAVTQRLLVEKDHQYESSRQSIDAVNAKLHDVRHEVLRQLDRADAGLDRELLANVAREISVYDTRIRTGNVALDTVLTERRLLCERSGITLTCVADGAALDFMGAGDLYALFDDVLDAVIGLSPTSVSLVVRQTLGVASIHVEHDGAGETGPLDETHSVASRYGGSVSVRPGQLDVILPLPE